MDKHVLHLTSPQLLKFKKGLGFQLNNQQIQANEGKHSVELHMNPADIKKLNDAIKNNRGFRFGKHNIQGGSILKKVVRGVKKYVPKDLVKHGLAMGVDALGFMATGTPIGELARPMIDKAVDDVYAGKSAKKMAKSAYKKVKNHALTQAEMYAMANYPEQFGLMKQMGQMDPNQLQELALDYAKNQVMHTMPSSSLSDYRGFSGSGLKKGSVEAKERMAKLRAMRKSKSGQGLGKIAHRFKKAFSREKIKDNVITYGIPAVTATLGGIAGSEYGPVGMVAGSAAGRYAGVQLANQLNGEGLKHIKNRHIHVEGGNLINGIPRLSKRSQTFDRINTADLLKGGSFASPG